jgi:hypothetical protein
MAFQLTINGVDYTNYFRKDSVSITEGMAHAASSMEFTCYIPDAEIDKPLEGNEIIFTRDGVREFAGRVATVFEEVVSPGVSFDYSVSCVGYEADLDTKLIKAKFAAQNADEMVRAIVNEVGLGITTNNVVVTNIPVAELDADYIQPSAALSRVVESIEHQWYVDFDRDVNFFFILDRPAPLIQIDVDADSDTYADLTIEGAWEHVKNRLYIMGAKAKSTNQDTINTVADGSQKFWPLNYEPWDVDSITVTIDGTPQNLFLDTVNGQAGDGGGGSGDAYICLDNWGVRLPDDFPPGDGLSVAIAYNYAYEPVVVVEDPDSIAEMESREHTASAPSDGVHEARFDVPDLRVTSENSIWEYGQLLLLRYANIIYNVSFTSKVQGWHAGQNLRVFSTVRDFDRTCYIKTIRKRIRRTTDVAEFEYEIQASTNIFPG